MRANEEFDFTITELTIVLLAKNNNPSILNPDFLKFNSVVKEDWGLISSPVCTEQFSEVRFKNGIVIRSQFDKVIFSDIQFEFDNIERLVEVVSKYIRTLPHVNYSAVGLNPSGHVNFKTENYKHVKNYLTKYLLSDGPWLELEAKNITAGYRIAYDFEDYRLIMNIEEADYKRSDSIEDNKVIHFKSNFHYDVESVNRKDKIDHIIDIINGTTRMVDKYKSVIVNTYMGGF